MFDLYTIAMKLPTLKHLLIKHLGLLLLWMSHMSNYTIAISNLDNTLITCSLKSKDTLLNICVFFKIVLTTCYDSKTLELINE